MRRILTAMLAVALLGACGKAPDGTSAKGFDVAEEPAAAPTGGTATAIKVSAPQIAYVYRYGYRMPTAAIAAVQERHIALCDRLGPAACRVLDMQRAMDDEASASGSLKMMVRADLARQFGRALGAAASQAGGTQADSSIAAEDLSKQIVDTEARLRAKQALADRLMELLRTRSGPVADLVAAERSVADVQEEIDAARSWLAEARGRVAMSTIELTYGTDGLAGGFIEPLRSSFRTMATVFGQSVALLIQLIAMLLPWLAVGGAIAFGVRWLRRKRRAADEDERGDASPSG